MHDAREFFLVAANCAALLLLAIIVCHVALRYAPLLP